MTSQDEQPKPEQEGDCPPIQGSPPWSAPRPDDRPVAVQVRDRDGDQLPIADAPLIVVRGGERLREYRTDRHGRALVRALPGDYVAASAFGCRDEKEVGQDCGPLQLAIAVGFSVEVVRDGDTGSCAAGHVTQGHPLRIRLQSHRPQGQAVRPRFAIAHTSQGQVLASPLECDSDSRFVSEFVYDSRHASGRIDFEATLSDPEDTSQHPPRTTSR